MILFGVIQQQPHGVSPPPPTEDIIVETITVTPSGNQLIGSYTTSGNSEKNQLPIATNLQLSGMKNVGQEINASWDYFHINNSPEGSTEIAIQTADDDQFDINLETVAVSSPYTIELTDAAKYIRLAVTPKTSDGTDGVTVYTQGVLVGNALIQRKVNVSLGSSSSPNITDDETWNQVYTDNPDATYNFFTATGGYLKRSDGVTITGLNLIVDLAMSDNNTGSTLAGTGDASEFPAGVARGYWYPAGTPARGFKVVTVGGLGIGIGEAKVLSNLASGTNEAFLSVNGAPSGYYHLPNITANPPGNGCVAYFEDIDMSGDITFRSNDGVGLSAINGFILYYYEES